jgi:hypothetical protein
VIRAGKRSEPEEVWACTVHPGADDDGRRDPSHARRALVLVERTFEQPVVFKSSSRSDSGTSRASSRTTCASRAAISRTDRRRMICLFHAPDAEAGATPIASPARHSTGLARAGAGAGDGVDGCASIGAPGAAGCARPRAGGNCRFFGGHMTIMYHEGNRQLQDQFDSRRISDRLEEKLTRTAFTADDKAFIESVIYFFLSTADAEGRPDCSFKADRPAS